MIKKDNIIKNIRINIKKKKNKIKLNKKLN